MTESSGNIEGPRAGVRFVVLFHRHPREGDHFDLMMDRADGLATWKTPVAPELAAASGLLCRRLPAHRRLYLDYQGPISGDRGSVTQHDAGECCVENCTPGLWHVRFHGSKLVGLYELVQSELRGNSESWLLRRLE